MNKILIKNDKQKFFRNEIRLTGIKTGEFKKEVREFREIKDIKGNEKGRQSYQSYSNMIAALKLVVALVFNDCIRID